MKRLLTLAGACALALTVTACSHERTVVEKPVVVQPTAVAPAGIVPQRQFIIPDSAAHAVETICPNGYSNVTHSCY